MKTIREPTKIIHQFFPQHSTQSIKIKNYDRNLIDSNILQISLIRRILQKQQHIHSHNLNYYSDSVNHLNLPNCQRRMVALFFIMKNTKNDKKYLKRSKRRKRHNGTLPLAFIGCGKNVVAQNPFHHVTENIKHSQK